MKFFKLFPPEAHGRENEWTFDFLLECHTTLAIVIDEEDEQAKRDMRKRNERLTSYLGRLNAVYSSYLQYLDFQRKKYRREHPKPEKGVTEWREAMDAELADPLRICEHAEGLIKAIETRVSVTQSNLKSLGKE